MSISKAMLAVSVPLLLAIVPLCLCESSDGEGFVTISASNGGASDDLLALVISIDDNTGIWGLTVEVDYDESALTPIRVEPSGMLSMVNPDFSHCPFSLVFDQTSLTDISSTGTLATVYFRPVVTGDYQYPVALCSADVVSMADKDVSISLKNSTIAPVSDWVYGDVDGKDGVTIKDVLFIKRYLAKYDDGYSTLPMDVDGKEGVSLGDVLCVKKYLAKYDVENVGRPGGAPVTTLTIIKDGLSRDYAANSGIYAVVDSNGGTVTPGSGAASDLGGNLYAFPVQGPTTVAVDTGGKTDLNKEVILTLTYPDGSSEEMKLRLSDGSLTVHIEPNHKEYTGYRFEGWYDNADFSGEAVDFDSGFKMTGNTELFAKYTKLCTLTLVYNKSCINDSVSVPSVYEYETTVGSDCQTLIDEKDIHFVPSVNQFSFSGWFTDEKFTNEWNLISEKSRTLYAKFESDLFPEYNPVVVTQDENGNSVFGGPLLFDVLTNADGTVTYVYYVGTAKDVLLSSKWENYNTGGTVYSESNSVSTAYSVSNYVGHTVTDNNIHAEKNATYTKNTKTNEIISDNDNTVLGNISNALGMASGATGIAAACSSPSGIPALVLGVISGVCGIASSILDAIDSAVSDGGSTSTDTTVTETVKEIFDVGWKANSKTIGVTTTRGYVYGSEKTLSENFKYAPVGKYIVAGVFGTVDYYQLEKYDSNGRHVSSTITYSTFDYRDGFASSDSVSGFFVDLIDLQGISKNRIVDDTELYLQSLEGSGSKSDPYVVDSQESANFMAKLSPGSYLDLRLPEGAIIRPGWYDLSTVVSIHMPSKMTSESDDLIVETNSDAADMLPALMMLIHSGEFDSLEDIVVTQEDGLFFSIDGVLCMKAPSGIGVIWYPDGRSGEFVVPLSVHFVESLHVDNGYSFSSKSKMTRLVLHDSVENIGGYYLCHEYVPYLERYEVDPKNQHYSSLNGVLYDKGKTALIRYALKNNDDYAIPNTIKEVKDGAFDGAVIDNLTIPTNLKFDFSCIENCGVKKITYNNITFNMWANEYQTGAFHVVDGCLYNPADYQTISNTLYHRYADYSKLVRYVGNDANVTVSEKVDAIGDYAFYNCKQLESITIPKTVKYIGAYAFAGCENLREININGSQVTLGVCAFYGCASLKYVDLWGCSVIKKGAFKDCTSLQNVSLYLSVELEAGSFDGCTNLKQIMIPDNASFECSKPYVYQNAAKGWKTLINDRESVLNPFTNCTSLKSISSKDAYGGVLIHKMTWVREGVEDTTTYLVSYPNSKGSEYIVPAVVDEIGYEAFIGCTSPKSITISKPMNLYFLVPKSLEELVIPDGSTVNLDIMLGKDSTYSSWSNYASFRYVSESSLDVIKIPQNVTVKCDVPMFLDSDGNAMDEDMIAGHIFKRITGGKYVATGDYFAGMV